VSLLSVELRPVESSVIDIGHAQRPQEPALEPAQLGREDHRRSPPYSERVTLHVLKQVDQSAGRGAATFAALGIQRQACDRLAIHGATELAFQQGLGQERKEIDTKQRLDATGLLESTTLPLATWKYNGTAPSLDTVTM
jgi:hypothetical protein